MSGHRVADSLPCVQGRGGEGLRRWPASAGDRFTPSRPPVRASGAGVRRAARQCRAGRPASPPAKQGEGFTTLVRGHDRAAFQRGRLRVISAEVSASPWPRSTSAA
jgi:hypothetical protein